MDVSLYLIDRCEGVAQISDELACALVPSSLGDISGN